MHRMIHILIIILVLVALICTFYPKYNNASIDRDIDETNVGEDFVEQYPIPISPVPPVVPPVHTAHPVPLSPVIVGGNAEGFCAFGGMAVPAGWREGNRAWPGWNTISPFGPRSAEPSVWY